MSTTVKLVTLDGDERTVTLSGLRQHLESEEANLACLTALMREGFAEVVLGNGVAAVVTAENVSGRPAQLGLPIRLFDVSVSMLVPLPAYARCPANSSAEAAEITAEVLGGDRLPPSGFRVEVSQDDLEALVSTIQVSLPTDPQWIQPHHVQVTNVAESLMLGAPS